MNKNTIIGIVIIVAILIAFNYINSPSKEELKQRREKDSIEAVTLNNLKEDSIKLAEEKALMLSRDSVKNDSVKRVSKVDTSKTQDSSAVEVKNEAYGVFASSLKNENKYITIESDLLKLKFNTLGGNLSYVQLKKYRTYDTMPLVLFQSDSSMYGLTFGDEQGNVINTRLLSFTPVVLTEKYKGKDSIRINAEDSVILAMRLYPDSSVNPSLNKYLEFQFTVRGNEYMLGADMNFEKIGNIITSQSSSIDLDWQMNLRPLEKTKKNERNASTVYYKYYEDEVDYLSETSQDEEELKTKVSWIGFKQQFFSSVLIADKGFANADIAVTPPANDTAGYLKSCVAKISVPLENKPSQNFAMRMYFGPNHFQTMRKYDLGLERQIPLGWSSPYILGWINRFAVIPVFNLLESWGLKYGIIILILTILLKIVLFPIAYKTYLSSAKMRVLKPEIDEINAKIPKEKAMERQQATMALYKKAGVNPLAGCVPMLLQMPILIALFRFFPSSIELRQQSFLWADDLSTYDSVLNLGFNIPFYGDHVSLFCLLMTISTIIYTKVNNQLMGTQQQMPGMKFMMYAMPVMFLGFFNDFSAGLSYYYFLANMLTFLQMWIIRKTVNEEAIHAKIQENRRKPDTKKKSGFQKRLEEMAKQRGYKMPKK